MKTIKFLGILGLLSILSACSGNNSKNAVTLTVEPQLGELSEYLRIASSEVTVKMEKYKDDGETERKILTSIGFDVTKGVACNSSIGFRFALIVLDENHIEIGKLHDVEIETKYVSGEDYPYILSKGTTWAQLEDNHYSWDNDDQEKWDKIVKEGKYLLVKPDSHYERYIPYNKNGSDSSNYDSSEYEDDQTNSDSEISENTNSDENTNINENSEALLSEFKSVAAEAVALSKKVKDGDENAKLELAQKTAKYSALSNKIMKLAEQTHDMELMMEYQEIASEYLSKMH